ncbi:unnamed protein product [Schistosoma curassoni]|uniref:Transposase n=1 Tax=Schistosoma curassoni TaxID=6186 RepID=A0A183KWR0_9TREM|nr:unnamed protein product [Schistosoma curassoni]
MDPKITIHYSYRDLTGRVYCAAVHSVLLYGSETWPVRVEDIRRLLVFDHRSLRSIARISWDHREKRILDLKKKNQELEKFKYVLDYKINELKKQIEPRENDIKTYKEQIQDVSKQTKKTQFFSFILVA